MNDLIFILIAAGFAFGLVVIGFILGGILPGIIKNSSKSDLEVLAYLKEKSAEVEPVVKTDAAVLEKQLYSLELSMACVLGDKLAQDLQKEKEM